MRGYILRYNYDIVSVTNDVSKWLAENNKQRIAEGEEPEDEATFNIEEIDLDIYDKPKKVCGICPKCEYINCQCEVKQ